MKYIQKIKVKHFNMYISLAVAIVFILTVFSATMAFIYNEEAVTGGKNDTYLVNLTKYEYDTTIPLPGAVFELYKDNDEKIGAAEYTTNQQGEIEISSLDVADFVTGGSYYFKEIDAPYGYQLDTTDDHHIYPFTFDEDNDIIFIKAYNQKSKQQLKISKVSVGEDIDENQEFTFKVTIGTDTNEVYTYSIDNGANQTIKSGETIKLKTNQIAVIEGIEVGTTFSIIEETVSGYITSYTSNTSGNMTAEGVVSIFINEKVPTENKTTLTITKVVFGDTSDLNKDFNFTLKIEGKADETFTLKHGESKVFDQIDAGVNYEVIEDNYSSENFVTESEGSSGTIVDGNNIVVFTNTKQMVDPTQKGILVVSKFVTGDDIDTDKEFEFVLKIEGEADQTFTLKHGESKTFTDIDINKNYIVSENDYSDEGYVTSSTKASGTIQTNTQTVFINDKQTTPINGNSLTITKSVLGEKEDKEFEFTVKIDGEADQTFTLKHGESKLLDELEAGKSYQVIENDYMSDGYVTQIYNASGTITNGNKRVLVVNHNKNKVMIDIAGKKTWDHRDNPSESWPTQIEVMVKADGETVEKKIINKVDDNWEYSFTVPKYKSDGVTAVDYSIDETPISSYIKEITGYDLHNRFTPTVSIQIGATKKITGETPLSKSIFTFELERLTDQAPMPGGSDVDKVNIEIEGQGNDVFQDIKYDHTGIYEYKLTEINGGILGYTYDDSEYIIVVEVSEEGDDLNADYKIFKKNQIVDSVVFVNEYKRHYETEYGDLIISKMVAGSLADANKAFDFTVTIGEDVYDFSLKHGQTYKVEGILVGTSYKVEEKNYIKQGYITTSEGSNGTIVKGMNEVKFVNTKNESGETGKNGALTIRKEIQGGIDKNMAFTFYVRIDGIKYTIQLKGGESHTFKDIPYGTSYNVEEHNYYEQGFEASSKNSSGTISGDVQVEFINRKRGELDYTGGEEQLTYIMFVMIMLSATLVIVFTGKKRELFGK